MSLILSCQSVSKAFGADPLFENVSLVISEGDRLGLIGPNGAGKSTLLQILAGRIPPDEGTVVLRKGARLGYVPQTSEFPAGVTVRELVSGVLDGLGLEEVEHAARLASTLGRAGFVNGDVVVDTLSGGWKKRLAIACELAREPDILLLDEPTNHLDLEGILWLEKLIQNAPFATIVISHDRYFLENVATSMAELNRLYAGGLFRVDGNYSRFLERREEHLRAESKRQESLEIRVRREVEWLRRGPKARTTKSKARIDEAGRLIEELADISSRMRTATAKIDFTASGRQTKKLIEARGIEKSLGNRRLFSGLDLKLSPGVRLGLAGSNGSGKTTLLRILNGEIEPDAGTIERADNLQVVYFDQNREQLDATTTLRRALSPDSDSVIFRGRPMHVAGWAKRFLFRSEQLDMPVSRLSGGERARALIARLMLRPADVLLLDEPTNDLDIPTLEVLEENLLDFPGALVLVTHDRYLLDRVSTVILGLDQGEAGYFADYYQWEQAKLARPARVEKAEKEKQATEAKSSAAPQKKRLSYIEGREYEQMESKILAAEEELEKWKRLLQDPDVVTDP
ncbi:MAG: ABC-F family ATP-binding cassette domain-containing protein, partial [Bryobacteraceae bacterium]|nr:ABC-F family ATP-binding cassette domain-containing protein [Bryobacteraceae bacterium]